MEDISTKPLKKISYKNQDSDESDALSDSEPSEDNLDDDQIMKLIPKKYGKTKIQEKLDTIENELKGIGLNQTSKSGIF